MDVNDYPKAYNFNWGAALLSDDWAQENGCGPNDNKYISIMVALLVFNFLFWLFIPINPLAAFIYGIAITPLFIFISFFCRFLDYGFNSNRWLKESHKGMTLKEMYFVQSRWQELGYNKLFKNILYLILFVIIVAGCVIFVAIQTSGVPKF